LRTEEYTALIAYRRIGLAALVCLGALGRVAAAQTLVSGGLIGTVADRDSTPLGHVRVTVRNLASGFMRSDTADGAGRFAFATMPIGQYEVRAEKLGYRPMVVLPVAVEAATQRVLRIALLAEQPPVSQVDTALDIAATGASGARATWSRWFDLAELGDRRHLLPALAAVAAAAPRGLELEGLPSRWSAIAVDGSGFGLRSSPRSDRPEFDAFAFPLWAFDGADLDGIRADPEWPGYGGGLLRGYPTGGPREVQPRLYAMGGNEGFDGAAVLGAPLVRDTAGLVVGVLASRRNPQYAAPWRTDSSSLRVDSLARDSFATDLGDYLRPYHERSDLVNVFARFDWQLARGHTLGIWGSAGDLRVSNLAMGPQQSVGLGSSLHAREAAGAAVLTSRISDRVATDVRFAMQSGDWNYGGSGTPGTEIGDAALAAGTPGTLPGQYKRTSVQAGASLYYRRGSSLLKGGLSFNVTSYDDELDDGRAGTYTFGSATLFGQRRGVFSQMVGGLPIANFQTRRFGLFFGNEWRPTPTLDLMTALRIDREIYPTGEATQQGEWLLLTGVDNALLHNPSWHLLPRFAMRWSGVDRLWALRADAAIVREPRDPATLDEWLAYDGGPQARRAVGNLGAWPLAPDSVVAPVQGAVLTVLNPRLESPRTGRVSAGIDHALGTHGGLHLTGTYRHSDFLARRSDLNLLPGAIARDQDGRPVYGALVQLGGLVAATPGSNRRFTGFDVVSGIDPTGYSDYWGVTVALDRVAERGLNLRASYTYSRTTDNVPGLAGGATAGQLSPFPQSVGSTDWRDGRSDLDVPHRAALAMEWRSGGAIGMRLGVLVQYRSGYSFTPGFRDGVDANGDGSAQNDPAFVTDTITGAAGVIAGSSCLREQVGRFASRNSCRGPAITTVDARFAVRLFDIGGLPAELVVDGLNLLRTDEGIVDRALYLVDPTRTLGTAQVGTVVVPLVINPNFGRLLVRRSAPSAVRAGFRFNF
jgi:hypothetical protein